jgi:eukaryotic-like serine/threonine-protein kinase
MSSTDGGHLSGPRTLAGRYRLERPLAFGGMAEVWIATDVVLDRRVAVKMLRPELASDPQVVERFRREAVAAARLNHPNIVSLFDTVTEDGLEAVVLELVPGRTLRQLLDDEGRLSVSDTVHIGIALADALDAAHRAGLVHRDVKPGNVLITPSRRVMLTDFGIATALGRHSDITREDVMQGTAKYLSPEQVLGVPTDARSDIYSLGVVLYECLTGRVPFEAESDAATALARLQQPARPVRAMRPGVPRVVDDLVCACLTRSPDGRPSSGADVRDTLVRLEGTVVDDGRLVIERDPTPSGLGVSGLGVSALGGSGVVRTVRSAPVQKKRSVRPGRWTVAVGLVVVIGVAIGVAGALVKGTGIRSSNAVRPTPDGLPSITPTSTPATVPGASSTTAASTTAATVALPTGRIAGTQEFDPLPGDGTENPAMLEYLTDANPGTSWTTLCYESRDLAPKKGVGIIIRLRDPRPGAAVAIDSPTTGWSAEVYVSETKGATLKSWGRPVAVGDNIPGGRADFPLGLNTGSFVLVWIKQLGGSTACERPFSLRITDVRIVDVAGQ